MAIQENNKLQMFEDQPIRTAWDENAEEWYFSVVDACAVLAESKDPAAYWRKLKQRLKEEGNETVTNCHALKMKAADGKRRLTDVATTEQLLRIIQSIPSKKAEPFKLWLAQVGRERIEEIIDPELTIERALATYAKKGYPANWINQRLQTIRARKELTDAWKEHGVEEGKAAFAEYLDETNLDSRQIYFVNQIVEFIVHNGMMKDLSVLQETPFTDQGSIVEVFTDLTVWMGIRRVIEQVNANALAA